jgi:hypothetical protein
MLYWSVAMIVTAFSLGLYLGVHLGAWSIGQTVIRDGEAYISKRRKVKGVVVQLVEPESPNTWKVVEK